MLGNNLLRYQLDQQWLIFDFEANGLNTYDARPWELSFAVGTLAKGLGPIKTYMIKWPKFRIAPHVAAKTHFDEQRYRANAVDPKVVWDEFAPLLYSSSIRAVGHNILGYDTYMINIWRRLMGLSHDHSWIGGVNGGKAPMIDTDCLAKAYKKGWIPNDLSNEGLLAFIYKAEGYIEKGLKTKLGVMCESFGIEYDEKKAHASAYDIDRNWLVFKELVKVVEI